MTAPLPPNETERLRALYECSILDTAPEEVFDDITRLAAQVCGTPIAAISLIDEGRQWFKSVVGRSGREAPREAAFCAHTILRTDLLVVPDTHADPRFAENPQVTGPPYIRFYAGVPLITMEGHALGSLCVVDRVPRTLTPDQGATLRLLARQVCSHLRAARRAAERERAEAALAQTHSALRAVLESAPLILYAADADGTVTLSEGKGLTALGLGPCEAVGHSVFEFSVGNAENEANMRRALAGEAVSYDARVNSAWLHTEVRPLRGADGTPAGIIGVCLDVTERMRAEERVNDHAVVLEFQELQKSELEKVNAELASLATTDGLTGLKNHRAFQERLAEEVSRTARYGTPLSLILLDVDRFKHYNDSHGHPAGDAVLMAVASILQQSARDTDLVARYGGEEFVLILPQTDLDGASAFAERLRVSVEGHSWPVRAVTASFGVAALRPDEYNSALIARADEALYQSKAAGRNRVTSSAGMGNGVARHP